MASPGLGKGCPLSKWQSEREEKLKARRRVRQVSNSAGSHSVPPKAVSFLEPHYVTCLEIGLLQK